MIEVAALLAAGLGERLVLVHAVTDSGIDALETGRRRKGAAALLEGCQRSAEASHGLEVHTRLRGGGAAAVILAAVQEEAGSLIVLGSRGRPRLPWPTLCERLERWSPVPVLALQEGTTAWSGWLKEGFPLRLTVGVGLEGSFPSVRRFVATLFRAGPISPRFVHVVGWGRKSPLELERLEGTVGASSRIDILHGRWPDALLAFSQREETDVTILGGGGLRGDRLWRRGARLLSLARCATVVVPVRDDSAAANVEIPLSP